MSRFGASLVVAAFASFVFACGASPSTANRAAATPPSVDRTAAPPTATCPRPKQTTDACAAVMVYVKIGDACCAYGSPCEAADGKTFSDDKCTTPG